MTSNIFRIFGILLLIFLAFYALNRAFIGKQPAVSASKKFITAIANRDKTSLLQVLDTSNAELPVGDNIASITFKEVHPGKSPFSKLERIQYSYLELTAKQIPPDAGADTTPDGQLATVPLTDGGRIYLRMVDGQWKVFYIDKAPTADDKR